MNLSIVIVWILLFNCVESKVKKGRELQKDVIEMVRIWSQKIGEKLTDLSKNMTREEKVEEAFKPFEDKLEKENGAILVKKIAAKIRTMMDSKADAVKKISEYAELLSYHRSNESLFDNSTYHYFNADNITDNERNPEREDQIANDILEAECHWACQQMNFSLHNNIYSSKSFRDKLFLPRRNEKGSDCECSLLPDRTRDPNTYQSLPMEYDERFDDYINFNLSVTKLALNVYERDQSILEGVRWSEALDLVFKDNYNKDKTLTWQYFASPRGFMRHYPAVRWSDERYDKTYDFRTRTWYTEAITSPKDVIILLDRSGSMAGTRRALSLQIVNQILDTLNDNDFVNIYTFTNTTEPLVNCFNDTLVQANEENLRLLRENLTVYDEEFAADLFIGFEKAFEILENFRMTNTSTKCNQAIMIITEGIDYYYDKQLFIEHNKKLGFPVRIFTYQVGFDTTDAKELEEIACTNMGYWVNITHMGDIREKMLNYLNVMSRPINLNRDNKHDQKFIWSYLHVDLADRRLSNWLWKKYEGIRQRDVFLDHAKRKAFRLNQFFSSSDHMLLQETHEFHKYEADINYKYMTTVSLPVFGRRQEEVELIGVAAVDVPVHLFKAQIPYEKLGVNGYAFITTNNGYILIHPDHRTEFKRILKPTFNRVDIVEVEILNDSNEPRLFGEDVVQLREKLVNQNESGTISLHVKYSLNDMKRVMLAKRHYFYAPIGPFTLGIVLPDKYGFVKIDISKIKIPPLNEIYDLMLTSANWKVHPEWIYCNDCRGGTPEDKVRMAFGSKRNSNLLKSLFYDINITKWFNSDIENEDDFILKYHVHKVFLSTYSGLTRWKTFSSVHETDRDNFEIRNNRAIDEDWYKRSVEINFKDENIFIYSVPFETSGYENNTMITSTKAIFVENGTMKTPVAVVGLQFNHRAMYELYNDITTKCIIDGRPCNYTCESNYLNCFILDNNAYVVLSDEPEFIGRYIGDIRPDVMFDLIQDEVYIPTRMFDYQAICQKLPPEPVPREEREKMKKKAAKKAKSSGTKLKMLSDHFLALKNWLLGVISFFLNVDVLFAWVYNSTKEDTISFNKLVIVKTFPTPCDHEMWLFNLNSTKDFPSSPYHEVRDKFDCDWPYVVNKIANTNLLFLAINGDRPCTITSENSYQNSPEPTEIIYNLTLPCYIATKNNYTRRLYMGCHNRDRRENGLNDKSHYFCGHTWK